MIHSDKSILGTVSPSSNGTTPLMAAAGLGYNRGGGSAFIKNRRDFSSYNPVASAELGSRIPAAEERRALEAVTVALTLGADVNAATTGGRNPVFIMGALSRRLK